MADVQQKAYPAARDRPAVLNTAYRCPHFEKQCAVMRKYQIAGKSGNALQQAITKGRESWHRLCN